LTYPDLLGPLKSSKKEIQQRKKCVYRTLSQHFKIIYSILVVSTTPVDVK
jgi:hypothetical protein